MAKALLIVAALLAAPAVAAPPKKPHVHLNHRSLQRMPMMMYKADCATNSAMNKALRQKRAALIQNPGAGLGEITPFERVFKDGFYNVDCVKDSTREFGDKFGNGKQSYNMGETANVSIIHYTEVVPKEDQEPMTHEVCFDFCRTVKDMLFFGIHNGRDCYCTPYFDPMESGSTDCDSVCEGASTQMCGGKVKSSIFGMHACMNMDEKLGDLYGKGKEVRGDLYDEIENAEDAAGSMQYGAEKMQELFGQLGDPAASNLMQEAKAFAGKLEEAARDSLKVADSLGDANKAANSIKDKDLTKFENADKADEALKTLMEEVDKAEEATEKIDAIGKLALPENEDTKGKAELYRPVMYFAGDKTLVSAPSTCSGDMVGKPMSLISEDECAAECEVNFQKCTAYAFVKGPRNKVEGSVCFMFSYVKTATIYTGCKEEKGASFLQQKTQAAMEPVCKLRLSSYGGTNISPESDRAKAGKCPNCLKELTKRGKCPMQMKM